VPLRLKETTLPSPVACFVPSATGMSWLLSTMETSRSTPVIRYYCPATGRMKPLIDTKVRRERRWTSAGATPARSTRQQSKRRRR